MRQRGSGGYVKKIGLKGEDEKKMKEKGASDEKVKSC